jgi:hypothetical protein
MNDKHQFKQKVLMWLGLHNLYPAKVKVFNTKRNGFEVRVYCPPMEYTTKKVSYRKKDWEILKTDEQGRPLSFRKHGSIGHTIKQPMYIFINQNNFADTNEQKFIIQMVKDSAILK